MKFFTNISFRDEETKEKLHEAELDTIIRDQVNRLPVIKLTKSAKSLDLIMGREGEIRVSYINLLSKLHVKFIWRTVHEYTACQLLFTVRFF